MNLTKLQEKYGTNKKCLDHLKMIRWDNVPTCPHCGSTHSTPRKASAERKTPMYHCNGCNKDYTVLMGTIFEGSKMPLPKWFMLITLMLNAKKGISAMQLSRDLGITYKTAWYSAMRVRCALLDQADMLDGIVEMDEAFIGGKFRKRKGKSNVPNIGYKDVQEDAWIKKKGRSPFENKVAVVGIVERGKNGRVVMNVKDQLRGDDLLKMLKRYVNLKKGKTKVMTDDYNGYKVFKKIVPHYSVNHSKKEYVKYLKGVKESIHTNTIEGVWSIIKNGIRGQYHVLSKKYLPFYLAEAAYKYNRRGEVGSIELFTETIENAVNEEKCSVKYKPKAHPSFLANRLKKKKASERKKNDNISVRLSDGGSLKEWKENFLRRRELYKQRKNELNGGK